MLNDDGKSGLKSIVSQCLASLLRVEISKTLTIDNMFDYDLQQQTTDQEKIEALKTSFESDPFIRYIVQAIKHAVGVS